MRDLLERLKLERRIALALFTVALLSIAALQFLAPTTPETSREAPESIPSAGVPQ